MNERIQELVNKAISDVDYIRDDDFTNEELSKMYIPDCFAEKFAELIVRECARIAAQTPFPDADEDIRKTFGHTWDMACVKSAKDIRKHFGVE